MTDTPAMQEPVTITDTFSNTVKAIESTVASVAPVVAATTAETPPAQEAPKETSKEPEVKIDDWREITGNRFKSEGELAKAYKEAQKLIASTRAIPELKKDATLEEITKYRETYGIPIDSKSYNLEVDIPENLKPAIEGFLEIAHKNNRSEALVKNAVADYLKFVEVESLQLTQKILDTQRNSENQLKESWGPRYEDNKKIVENFFTKTFGEDAQTVLDAYLPDGTRMGDNAKIASKLLEISKNTLGATTVIPNSMNNNNLKDNQDRYNQLVKMSQNSKSDYWGPNHAQIKQEMDSLEKQLKGR